MSSERYRQTKNTRSVPQTVLIGFVAIMFYTFGYLTASQSHDAEGSLKAAQAASAGPLTFYKVLVQNKKSGGQRILFLPNQPIAPIKVETGKPTVEASIRNRKQLKAAAKNSAVSRASKSKIATKKAKVVRNTHSKAVPKKHKDSASVSASGAQYTVQVSSFKKQADAKSEVQRIRGMGFDNVAAVPHALPKRGTWYRVRVGRQLTRDKATRLKESLIDKGLKGGMLIRHNP